MPSCCARLGGHIVLQTGAPRASIHGKSIRFNRMRIYISCRCAHQDRLSLMNSFSSSKIFRGRCAPAACFLPRTTSLPLCGVPLRNDTFLCRSSTRNGDAQGLAGRRMCSVAFCLLATPRAQQGFGSSLCVDCPPFLAQTFRDLHCLRIRSEQFCGHAQLRWPSC